MPNYKKNEKLLLDTHIWIYLLTGNQRIIKSGYLKSIENNSQKSTLFISSISLWEICMLIKKKRISINQKIEKFIESALNIPGLSIQPISPSVAIESCNLPGNFHGDPADRIIVASARVYGLTLLSFDKKIINYAKKGNLQLLEEK